MIPGEYFLSDKSITANVGKTITSISVDNTGDRPIQVGSHTHFFEVNKALEFTRKQSYGCHLNIPAGPGETKEVELTEFGGKRIVFGFSGLVNGKLKDKQDEAFKKAIEKGFKGL
jgi:urease subunit beta